MHIRIGQEGSTVVSLQFSLLIFYMYLNYIEDKFQSQEEMGYFPDGLVVKDFAALDSVSGW